MSHRHAAAVSASLAAVLQPRLYRQTFPKLSSDDELEEFLAALEANVEAQRAPFAWVVLADALLSSTAKQRRMFAAAEERMKEQDKKLCAGTAFVLTSTIARGAVTAVYWLSPPVPVHDRRARRAGRRVV